MKKGDIVRTWSSYLGRWEYGIVLGLQVHVSPTNDDLDEYIVYFFDDRAADHMLERHMEVVSEA